MTGTIISDQSVGVYSFAEDMDVSDRRLNFTTASSAFSFVSGIFVVCSYGETYCAPLVSSCTILHVVP